MDATLRARRLVAFCKGITPGTDLGSLAAILERAGVPPRIIYSERREKFERRKFHSSVVNHARDLFFQGNYFHAVFEAAKAYNKSVREKARSDKEGSSLMMDVWGCRGGVLKITKCSSETDVNVQDGIKFLSVGLMRAIRNPTAHEPATDWPINEEDCLDILSFISFLFRRLDMAEYYAG